MNLPLVIAVSVLKIAVVMGVLLTCVAYTVLLERKVLGFIQLRYGPNRVGPWGLLQPLADALKLLFKEDFTPPGANKCLFVIAPVITVNTWVFTVGRWMMFLSKKYSGSRMPSGKIRSSTSMGALGT